MKRDDNNIYFGVVCELSDLKHIDKIQPVGRDGQAYRYECLEIMLDPFGAREKYCHFILNPVPNSTYDRRFGYIDDPLHPLYDKGDKGWNGDWDYATTVDREHMRWTAEVRIPFASLEAEPPSPATKGPHRYGPFKDAFRHRMLFVYGTTGTIHAGYVNYTGQAEAGIWSADDPESFENLHSFLGPEWYVSAGYGVSVHKGWLYVGGAANQEPGHQQAILWMRRFPRVEAQPRLLLPEEVRPLP